MYLSDWGEAFQLHLPLHDSRCSTRTWAGRFQLAVDKWDLPCVPLLPHIPGAEGLRMATWDWGGGHCPCLPCPCPAPGPGTLWGLARLMACLQRNTRSYPKEFSATSSTPPASCRSSLHLSAEALSLLNHFQILY